MSSIDNILKRLREGRKFFEANEETTDTDYGLIADAKSGDQYAFDQLLDKYEGLLYRMTKKYVAENIMDEDDIHQLATIAFWDAVKQFKMKGDFESYAGMIIKRRMADELRKLSTDSRIANSSTVSIESAESGDADEADYGDMTKGEYDSYNHKTSTQSAEDEYFDNDSVSEIEKFMREELSDTERTVIKMYMDGAKMSQIAEETGMKYKSAENALMRVKNKVAEFLRTRESKKIREAKMIAFSEEEKKIIMDALTKIQGDEEEI